MESLMVEVKSPRYLSKDLFTGEIVCTDEDNNVVKCSDCSFCKQCNLGYANFDSIQVNILKDSGICVEEEEDSTAVADAGKSSYRDSETLHPDGSERSGVVNPKKNDI